MPTEITPDSTVKYTVKELLDEQTTILREIDRKVDGKADKADLVPVFSRLEDQDVRITRLEDGRTADQAAAEVRARFRRNVWLVLTAIMVPLAVAMILVYVR